MTQHITTDKAYSIDLDWQNADADAADMLPRLVDYKSVTLLTIPSLNGTAPTYQYRSHDPKSGAYAPAYYHTSGPTLEQWCAEQDAAKIEDEYRQRQEAFNAAQEAQRDEWEALKAEKRAKRAARQLHKRDAAELEAVLQAEYRDAYETRRDLCAGSVQ